MALFRIILEAVNQSKLTLTDNLLLMAAKPSQHKT